MNIKLNGLTSFSRGLIPITIVILFSWLLDMELKLVIIGFLIGWGLGALWDWVHDK